MTYRLALLSVLLLPLMACSDKTAAPDDTAAPSAPPAAETATPAAAETAPAPAEVPDSTPAPAEAEAAPPPPPPAAAGAPLVEGKDYVEIQGGQPFEPRNGKVEVVEVFGYVCPACAGFQPLVSAWKAKLPADVRFTYVPALFGGTWDNYARAYYTAESMGLVEKTHDDLYKAIHIDQTLKGERGMDTLADIAGFYGKHGADAKAFESTMASFAIAGKTGKAKQFALRSQISGTPSLIVDGKYLIKGASREDMLRIADQLIAQERAAQ